MDTKTISDTQSPTQAKQMLAGAIRELASLLDQAGRGEAASMLDGEAAQIAAGVAPRGLQALRRMNALRAGLAAAEAVAAELDRGLAERSRLRALADDIGRALRSN